MKKYIGTKQLSARPMTRGEYNEYRGWITPNDENPSDKGYLVEYPNLQEGDKPNHPDHAGYISWSPAHVFENTYKVSTTHVDRLRIEFDELGKKITKLSDFISTPAFDKVDKKTRKLLPLQLQQMKSYHYILDLRLND